MRGCERPLRLPDTHTAWGADHFLTPDESDIAHIDYVAKVEEGVRFADAAQRDSQIGLLNPMDPAVVNQANFLLPVYEQVSRLEVSRQGFGTVDLAVPVSDHQLGALCQDPHPHPLGHAVLCLLKRRLVVRTIGRDWVSSIQSGEMANGSGVGGYTPNTNLIYDPIRNILTRGAETFQILDVQDNPNHTILRLAQFWVDEIIDSYYWKSTTVIEGLNGSVISQSFLNSQGGWLTSVDLFFSRVASQR